jgi:hypothetical protein
MKNHVLLVLLTLLYELSPTYQHHTHGHHCIHDSILKSENSLENGIHEQRKLVARHAFHEEHKRGLYTNAMQYSFGPLVIAFRTDYILHDYGSRTCYTEGNVSNRNNFINYADI